VNLSTPPIAGWPSYFPDAQDGVNQLADKLQLSPPTVRTRLKSLIEKNILKIVGLLNLSERPELIAAIVGINANAQGHLDALVKRSRTCPLSRR
jgi:Lrp/AsnC family transcriptional regulator for asnA, asnC and gidA